MSGQNPRKLSADDVVENVGNHDLNCNNGANDRSECNNNCNNEESELVDSLFRPGGLLYPDLDGEDCNDPLECIVKKEGRTSAVSSALFLEASSMDSLSDLNRTTTVTASGVPKNPWDRHQSDQADVFPMNSCARPVPRLGADVEDFALYETSEHARMCTPLRKIVEDGNTQKVLRDVPITKSQCTPRIGEGEIIPPILHGSCRGLESVDFQRGTGYTSSTLKASSNEAVGTEPTAYVYQQSRCSIGVTYLDNSLSSLEKYDRPPLSSLPASMETFFSNFGEEDECNITGQLLFLNDRQTLQSAWPTSTYAPREQKIQSTSVSTSLPSFNHPSANNTSGDHDARNHHLYCRENMPEPFKERSTSHDLNRFFPSPLPSEWKQEEGGVRTIDHSVENIHASDMATNQVHEYVADEEKHSEMREYGAAQTKPLQPENSSVQSSSSIPFEVCSANGICKGESWTSSLSTSSCGSDEDESLSMLDTYGEADRRSDSDSFRHEQKNGEHSDPTDAPLTDFVDVVATVQQTPLCQTAEEKAPSPTSELSETSASTNSIAGFARVTDVAKSMRTTLVWYISFATTSSRKICCALWDKKIVPTRHEVLRWGANILIKFTTTTKIIRSRIETALRVCLQMTKGAVNGLALCSVQALSTLCHILSNVMKSLIILISFLIKVLEYSLIEACDEKSVTIGYLVFYFMPPSSSLLLEVVNLPHWTPHVISSIVVFVLCTETKSQPFSSARHAEHGENRGPSREEDSCKPPLEPHNHETKQRMLDSGSSHTGCARRHKRASRTILCILRYVLPLLVIANGFSSDFVVLGESGASRLTTAFMMSLVRKDLVSSPIGWLSWAVQVLIATYSPPSSFFDNVVLVVGFSSFRLMRYREAQQSEANRKGLIS